MIDIFEARKFAQAISGETDPVLVFQLADDRDCPKEEKNKDLTRVFVGTLDQQRLVLERAQKLGAAVWMQVNAGARGAKNITAARALLIDTDDGKERDVSACPPSIVVKSVNGYHYYWLLAPSEANLLDEWVQAQKRLALVFGTDKSVCNRDRVMRVPGTMHQKDPTNPRRVQLAECHPERRYTIRAVMDAFASAVRVDIPQTATDGAAPPDGTRMSPAALATLRRVREWLSERKVRFTTSPLKPAMIKLATCPFNATHGDSCAVIVTVKGTMWAGCFHDSCQGNRNIWPLVRDTIGGWFGQMPGFSLGDHVEIAQRALLDLRTGTDGEACLTYNGRVYRYSAPTGRWDPITTDEQSKLIGSYSGRPVGLGTARMKIKNSDVKGIMNLMREFSTNANFFDSAPPGLLFGDGFLHVLPDGVRFEPFAPGHRQRHGFNFPWKWDAPAPRWTQFLDEIFAPDPDAAEKRALLQEFIGACLIGQAGRLQKALLLIGDGANGKTACMNAIAALFPTEMRTAIRPQDFGEEYHRALLAGARVNLCSEVPEADILESEAFKAVVDGSAQPARHPYERVFIIKPQAGHIFAANRLPGVVDFTGGFWRRFIVLPFNRVFTEEERDPWLEAKLLAELPGICAWGIEGAIRVLQNGSYTEPASSHEAKQAWRESVDVLCTFKQECTTPAEHALIGASSQELYAAFREWCAANGHRNMSSTTFGRRMKALAAWTRTKEGVRYALHLTVQPLFA
jgi:P4 family phage/plasmid primase-like protien